MEPYIARGLVTVVRWQFALNDTWFNSIQSVSMNNVLWKYGEYNKWMMYIDVDEFVVPRHSEEESLLPLLSVSASYRIVDILPCAFVCAMAVWLVIFFMSIDR